MNKIETILQYEIDNKVKNDVILYKGEIFTFFDCGLTRYVFTNKDKTKVIKLLISERGKDYNEEEYLIYEKANENVKKEMAETTLEYDGMVIEQEFCEPIKFSERKLTIPQMLFARSCRDEVGWNKDGNLVCFDLDEYKKY